jgi:dodecin
MSIVKVIEVISEGKTIDDALRAGVEEASKTVENIKQINVDHIEGHVENNKIVKIRVCSKISFVVHH